MSKGNVTMVTNFSKEEREGIVVIGGANIDIKGNQKTLSNGILPIREL
jgi:hypothetical protein